MRNEHVRGHLDLLLLSVLARGGAAHGYALINALREHSGGAFDLPEGTVYPALHRLERDGLVVSRWEDGTARRRRVYEVTPSGTQALTAKRAEWRVFVTGIQAVVFRERPCATMP